MISDPILREVFVLWPAWQTLVERLLPIGEDARDVQPSLVADALGEMNGTALRQLAHLFVANGHTETVDEAVKVLGELWASALIGRRPRFGTEAGVTGNAFRDGPQ